jgi:hypothetical protein
VDHLPPRVLTLLLITCAFVLGLLIGRRIGPAVPQAAPAPADSAAAPKLAIPPGLAAVGFLDKVDEKAIVSVPAGGDVHLTGWAACADPASPLTKLEVLVDNHSVTAATLGLPRPDVGAAYQRPDFNNSGWKAGFSTQSIAPGTHQLAARATCANGGGAVLPAFQLVVQ